jgi:hypothetical protein
VHVIMALVQHKARHKIERDHKEKLILLRILNRFIVLYQSVRLYVEH